MNPNEYVEVGTRVRHERLRHSGTVVRTGVVREVVWVRYDGHISPVATAKRVLTRL